MAKIEKAPANNSNSKAEPTVASQCKGESCKHKPEKFGFCMEHYELYMAGVMRGDGKKPIDYDQKLARFLEGKNRSKRAA